MIRRLQSLTAVENKHVANADEEKTLKCNAADNLIASILAGAKEYRLFVNSCCQ